MTHLRPAPTGWPGTPGLYRTPTKQHADDHIHIVATLACLDGARPRIWNDFYRVREACGPPNSGLGCAPRLRAIGPPLGGGARRHAERRHGRGGPTAADLTRRDFPHGQLSARPVTPDPSPAPPARPHSLGPPKRVGRVAESGGDRPQRRAERGGTITWLLAAGPGECHQEPHKAATRWKDAGKSSRSNHG